MMEEELYGLFERYTAMPHGSERIDAIREAVKKADKWGDDYWRLKNRYQLAIEQYRYDDSGKVLPMIAEYVAIFEKKYFDTGKSPTHQQLDDYLYLLDLSLNVFGMLPQLPLAQCRQLEEQYWNALKRFGYGKADYYDRRYFQLRYEDRLEEAEEVFELWEKERQGNAHQVTSCEGCIKSIQIRHKLHQGKRDEALKLARPLMDGTIQCSYEPWRSLRLFMNNSRNRGERGGMKYYGRQLIRRLGWDENADEMSLLSYDALFDLPRGFKTVETSLGEIFGEWDQGSRWRGFMDAWLFFSQAAHTYETVSLAMLESFPLYREDGEYNTAELAQWFHEAALGIARKFDERNHSSYYQNKMQRAWDGMQKMTGGGNE